MKTNICIVGGGNSTHSLIPLLTKCQNSIRLFTRKPELWQESITMEYILPDGTRQDELEGKLDIVSSRAEDVIADADIILLSLPVSQYRNLLNEIAPYISKSKKVYVGTIYGQGGFNWMVEEIIEKYVLENVIYFASGLIPWITRTKKYGEVGINYGCKTNNVVAVSKETEFCVLQEKILDDLCYSYFGKGKYLLADNFMSLTLSVDNQIIHQTRLYGLYLISKGEWSAYEDVPFFYRDYDDTSAKVLEDLDSEYSLIRNEIVRKYPQNKFDYMLDYLGLEHFSYGSTSQDIKGSFVESETLGQIPTPVVEKEGKWIFDAQHRFFFDDIYYGIIIAKWIAEELKIDTPTMNKIIKWSERILNDEILDENNLLIKKSENPNFLYGTPDTYGYNTIDDIMG